MSKLLIPSRNRPTGLRNVLGYLSQFYPNTDVIVADGSSTQYVERYREVIEQFSGNLSIDYRSYDPELLFFDRLLDVLEGLDDELVIMGADDDYPLMDTIREGERFLLDHPDFSSAMGSLVHLKLIEDGRLVARFGAARTIAHEDGWRRARSFAEWPFSTTYAVTRRLLLIERFQRARENFLAGFYDFGVGLHDCLFGKFKSLPRPGYFSTRNHGHSYLRPSDRLVYLRRAADVLKLVEIIRDDLVRYGGADDEHAQELAEQLIGKRVAELAGSPTHKRPGFAESRVFNDKTVQAQYRCFVDLFEENNPNREQYFEKLKLVVTAMYTNAESADNRDENSKYETLAAQASG